MVEGDLLIRSTVWVRSRLGSANIFNDFGRELQHRFDVGQGEPRAIEFVVWFFRVGSKILSAINQAGTHTTIKVVVKNRQRFKLCTRRVCVEANITYSSFITL
jgi:hypothetical protein